MIRIVRLPAGIVLGIALLAAFAFRPHVVERWALYLGSASEQRTAHLYLEPFPDAATCESRVRVFAANAERAFCLGHREIALGGATDAVLAADFGTLSGAWCAPRRPVRRTDSRVASARAK